VTLCGVAAVCAGSSPAIRNFSQAVTPGNIVVWEILGQLLLFGFFAGLAEQHIPRPCGKSVGLVRHRCHDLALLFFGDWNPEIGPHAQIGVFLGSCHTISVVNFFQKSRGFFLTVVNITLQ
jgi:hypothetical protein